MMLRWCTHRRLRRRLDFGFRAGFLGLFHMEIIQERLEREYDLDVLFTAPSVEYEVVLHTGEVIAIDSPAQLPDEGHGDRNPRTVDEHRDHHADRLLRHDHGPDHQPARHLQRAGISRPRTACSSNFEIPLAELIVDFFDDSEVAHQRLCLARLPVCRISRRRAAETGNPGQRRAGGCAGGDCAQERRLS